MQSNTGPIPRGDTLIFSYIRRLRPFLMVQNFEFQYFWGFSEKRIFFWGYEVFVDFFFEGGGGSSHIWVIYGLYMGYFMNLGSFRKVYVQNGAIFGLPKFLIFLGGEREQPNIFAARITLGTAATCNT